MGLLINRVKENINIVNEWLAVKITRYFATIWTFYIFFIWGLLAFIPALSHYKEAILLISSAWIQLWTLPILSLGNTILNRGTETRALEDHVHIVEMSQLLHEGLVDLHNEVQDLKAKLAEISNIEIELAKKENIDLAALHPKAKRNGDDKNRSDSAPEDGNQSEYEGVY